MSAAAAQQATIARRGRRARRTLMNDRETFHARRTATTMESGKVGKGCLVGIGLVVLLLVLVAMSVGQYNGLVERRGLATAKWQEVDNQYKRRFDLVPNLVKTVEGVANFEKATLTAVTEARASVGRAQLPSNLPTDEAAMQSYVNAQQQLGSALSRLLVVTENYPELKASESFRSLQDQLEGTENRIAVARRDYIDTAAAYNIQLRKFPTNMLAGLFNFEPAAPLPMTAEERANPQVEFGDFGADKK
jgi:LemA protein